MDISVSKINLIWPHMKEKLESQRRRREEKKEGKSLEKSGAKRKV